MANEFLAESARRGNAHNSFDHVSTMSDQDFDRFAQTVYQDADRNREANQLASAAARHGKVLAEPPKPVKTTAEELDEIIAENESNDAA